MCVYETGLLLLFAYIALLLLPLSFFLGVGAPSLSLSLASSCSTRLDVLAHSHCVRSALAACVYETGLLLLFLIAFADVALRLLPLSLFLGTEDVR